MMETYFETKKVAANLANTFGAEIKLTLPAPGQQHLFLVKSNYPLSHLIGLVRSGGGQINFQGNDWIIAQLSFEAGMGLQQAPGIVFVGSIFLDAERFLAFKRLFGVEDQQT
jgi:hypothetical protein